MNAKNTVNTVVAALFAASLGMSGAALAGDRHHGGYGHGYDGGHGYSQHRGHGHGYDRHRSHGRGHGHHYGYRGHPKRYYRDSHDDLLIGLLLGGFAGYALSDGHHH